MSKYYSKREVDLILLKQFANGDLLGAVRGLPTIDIVTCEECRWQDDCSQFIENIEGTAMTLLRWCSDGERKEK